MKLTKITAVSIFLLLNLLLTSCGGGGSENASNFIPVTFKIESVVKNIAFPVSIVQSSDGSIFYSELFTGNVRIIRNGILNSVPVATLNVLGSGNEGLLGLALDPDFSNNGFLYAYYTASNPPRNVVTRLSIHNDIATDQKIIIDNLPFGGHDGGRLIFGIDGTLYISVGDAGQPNLAQLQTSYAGKILRLTREGTIPSNNPDSNSPIFASGLRNAFGLAIDQRDGVLFVSENGPGCDDEINRVLPSANLGWRTDQPCGDTDPAFTLPIVRFNPSIAPTGMTFYQGDQFPGLQNNLLLADFINGNITRFQVEEDSGEITNREIFLNAGLGQLIDIVSGEDGYIYIASTTAIYRLVP